MTTFEVQDVDGAVKEIEVQLPCDMFLEDEFRRSRYSIGGRSNMAHNMGKWCCDKNAQFLYLLYRCEKN